MNLSENSVIDTIRRHFDIVLYFSILSSNLCETLGGGGGSGGGGGGGGSLEL